MPPPPHPDERQQILDLALDTQEEIRHLVRLLSAEEEAPREAVACAAQLQRYLKVLTAGTVLRARRHRVQWEPIARLLNVSSETARRTFHEQLVTRQLRRLIPPAEAERAPGPPPTAAITATWLSDRAVEPPSPPVLVPSPRATSQLAPVLSNLHRAAGTSLRQLGRRVRVSASYLSRVFAGERFPSWELTERLAHALGADTVIVRTIWEADESRRLAARTTPAREEQRPVPTTEPPASLHSALRTLHQRAGSPTPRAIATVAGHHLSMQQVADALAGIHLPDWELMKRLIYCLDGEPAFFRPLWEAEHHAAAAPPPSTSPADRLADVFTAFGHTLGMPAPAFTR